jgi:hypothetical protein
VHVVPGLDEIEEIKPTKGGFVMSGVTRMIDPAGDFLVARINAEGFVGGDNDPIFPLDPRIVVSITPQVEDFNPNVMDASYMIEVEAIEPKIISADMSVTDIYRNK